MSTTVISQGFIAVLKNPILDSDEREELSEHLYDNKTGISINYEGTLLISDEYSLKSYSEREFYSDLFIVGVLKADKHKEFIVSAQKIGLEVEFDSVQPYVCVWYNGSDSPVQMLTKVDFIQGNY